MNMAENPVHVQMDYIFPGGAQHNLTCWLCQQRPAIYWGNPVWLFAPCDDCLAHLSVTFSDVADLALAKQRGGMWRRFRKWLWLHT